MKEYKVVGVMSGSSLDGLDVCLCNFKKFENHWAFDIIKGVNLHIPELFLERLKISEHLGGKDLCLLDNDYGSWIGEQLKLFLNDEKGIHAIGLHGHTVFHEPEKKLTLQIGNGQIVSHMTKIPVIDRFRLNDILEGGQGAPLVPKGEICLFPQYDGWINLGGIANITIKQGQNVKAWDIAPCNQVLNALAQNIGHPFDKDGDFARMGSMINPWLNQLNMHSYFQLAPPKSMSNQWVKENILSKLPLDPCDGLHTYCHFLAQQIATAIEKDLDDGASILLTGGGTKNLFLMDLLREKLSDYARIIIPEDDIIEFKEAIIFGFLGLLRLLSLENTIGSATGAKRNTLSGNLNIP